jgi:predicted DNA-binding transcriptional regulator YafY
VWRVRSVEFTGEPARRPPGFDLRQAWQEVVASLDERRSLRIVHARAEPELLRWLRAHFGIRLTVGETGEDGRVAVELGFPDTHGDPARELCGYGDGLEVVGPPDVRARLAELGRDLVRRYGT